MPVYVEALMRTMIVSGTDRSGIAMLTFTPLNGYTELVQSFIDACGAVTKPPPKENGEA